MIDFGSAKSSGSVSSLESSSRVSSGVGSSSDTPSPPPPSTPSGSSGSSVYSSGPGGCTYPGAPNYDPMATEDDGSCQTCANQGLCVINNDDCKGGNCNSVGNGCCDEGCLPCTDGTGTPTGDDCSPTFNGPLNNGTGFTAANGVYYASCYG